MLISTFETNKWTTMWTFNKRWRLIANLTLTSGFDMKITRFYQIKNGLIDRQIGVINNTWTNFLSTSIHWTEMNWFINWWWFQMIPFIFQTCCTYSCNSFLFWGITKRNCLLTNSMSTCWKNSWFIVTLWTCWTIDQCFKKMSRNCSCHNWLKMRRKKRNETMRYIGQFIWYDHPWSVSGCDFTRFDR